MSEQTWPAGPAAATGAGRGRDRRHLYPGRSRRAAPTFTEQEWADIAAAAAAAGIPRPGSAARRLWPPPGVTRRRRWTPTREGLAAPQAELFDAVVAVNRIGTNLNQAVAALNATGEAPDWLAQAVALCERRMARLDEVVAGVDRRLR